MVTFWADMEMVYLRVKGEPATIADLGKLPPPAENKLFIPFPVACNRENWYFDDAHDFPGRGYPKTIRDWDKLHKAISIYRCKTSEMARWKAHPDGRIWNDLISLISTDVEHFDGMRSAYAHSHKQIMLFYAVNALYLAHQGNHKQATESILTGIQVGESICNAPIPGFFAPLCKAIRNICKSVQRMVGNDELSQSDMQQIYDALGRIDLNAVTPDRLRWVRADCMGYLRHKELRGYRAVIDCESFYWEDPPPLAELYLAMPAWVEGFYLRPLTVLDRINYLHVSNRYVSKCKRPYIKLRREVYREYESSKKLHWWNGFYTTNFLKYFIVFLHYRDDTIAELGRTRVILAVHTYKQRFGQYPDTLKECGTRLGWELPQDPFSGGDFKYRRRGEGFDIYSEGRNFKNAIKQGEGEEWNPFMPYDFCLWADLPG
jgi:hypothetical protein